MAKGLRSSSKKSNRSKLRTRVFEPVENARLERIHQKLLETAQQPKPETAKEKEMDVDSAEDAAANAASKEKDFPKGSFFLSASIPQSLCDTHPANAKPTPAHDDVESRTLYDLLGLCSDVVGFAPTGALEFAFDPLSPLWLNMDVDGEKSSAKRNNFKDRKTIHKEKMLRRKKPRNQIEFPARRGKGALKPFSESRVHKRR
ncbi:hypothetical protein P171DRAFT_385007 [Karstenula rhodostoma CBS 690.94]|uniref:DUF2423 domain-containing protein n=1 Tax=Karstenula rhodostoma CBS 690.94 TaxID=1392251 RepID=A0A9P4PLH0_9PLEO|nr:hypothetical protein P171DRAFT_385007 [Karstenula rhodostoma CBS 690.94]